MDKKAAVRSMFESIEILVKQMVSTDKLTKKVVENSLTTKCKNLYKNDDIEPRVVSKLLSGFAQWVDGLNNYRHGQPSDEPVAPSEEVAIYVLSSGSAFLRWLIEINNQLTPSP